MTGTATIKGFEDHSLRVNGQYIAFSLAGEGPSVLLLHGFPQTRALWAQVASLTVMDIVPTHLLLSDLNKKVARAYYHWFFLSQPAPVPETLISADVDAFFHSCLTGWGGAGLKDFAPEQLDAYCTAWRDPACIHAMFNDYRAALDVDFDLDAADLDRQVTCPALVAYGTDGAMAQHYDMAAAWSPRLANMLATKVPDGHFFVDQSPEATAAALLTFLGSLT